MPKNVLRNGEFAVSPDTITILPPPVLPPAPLEAEVIEHKKPEKYTGPTADDLRREAELFKSQWEEERGRMESEARAQAEQIIQEAESTAFEEVRNKTASIRKEKEKAEQESRELVENARTEAETMLAESRSKVAEIEEVARQKGIAEGEEKGYESGRLEVERLTDRLHSIINKTIERRHDIIEESEAQLVQLVLQIAQKVIKVISEKQRDVVISNVLQALKKLKSKVDVVIRVNLADLQITTSHTKEFVDRIERVNSVSVMEDSTVDPGGAIIETDFGQIDARIMSQLRAIEEAILELAPIPEQK